MFDTLFDNSEHEPGVPRSTILHDNGGQFYRADQQ